MSKTANVTNVPDTFPDVTKLNDKRLLEIFKKYRKMINTPQYDAVRLGTIQERHELIVDELETRPHIER